MSTDLTTWAVSINDGPAQPYAVRTSIYRTAAAAVPAVLGIDDYPVKVKIWVPDLLPDYPGLTFVILKDGAAPLIAA